MDQRQPTYRQAILRSMYIIVVLTLGLAPMYVISGGLFPLGDASIQMLPYIVETKRLLASGTPLWSWNLYFGDNVMGLLSYYTLTRPSVWLVCLLPYRLIPAGFAVMVYALFLLTAWVASCYLRLMGIGRELRLAGSLLFALSSYMVCSLEYCMFYEPVIMFVVLLIAIERYLQGKSRGIKEMAFAACGVAFVNYYFMVSTILAAGIYVLCRLGSVERGRRWRALGVIAASMTVGVAMSAVTLLPTLLYIHGVARQGLDPGIYGANLLERLRSLFVPSHLEGRLPLATDTGWYMNCGNIAVTGLLYAALYAWGHRRSWLTWLIAIYLLMFLTPAGGVFTLFTSMRYTRWIYAMDLMVILATLRYFSDRRGTKAGVAPALVYVAIALVVYLVTVGIPLYFKLKTRVDIDRELLNLMLMTMLFVVNISAMVYVNSRRILSHGWRAGLLGGLAVVVVLQLWGFSANRIDRGPLTQYPGVGYHRTFTDYGTDRSLFEADPDAGFVSRTDLLTPHSNIDFWGCFSAAHNVPSVRFYSSLYNPAINDLIDLEGQHRHNVIFEPVYERESFDALMSVERVISLCDSVADFEGLEPIGRRDRATYYKSKYYIPIGMAYDKYMCADGELADSLYDASFLAGHDVNRAMLNALLVSAEDTVRIRRYMRRVEFADTMPLADLVKERRRYASKDFRGDTRGLTSTITLPDTMVVFYSVVSDRGFTATIDGIPTEIYNANMGLSAVIVPPGTHTIRFEYMPPGLLLGALVSLMALGIVMVIPKNRYRGTQAP